MADGGQCVLIPGVFGLLVQGILGCIALSILLFKYHFESPKRPYSVYLKDVAKQLASAAEIHLLNLTSSALFAHRFIMGDACDFYWLNIVLDTTLGVGINFCLLLATQRIFNYRSGDYNTRTSLSFRRQLALWLGVALVMKTTNIMILNIFHNTLARIPALLMSPFLGRIRMKLIFVMILTPLVMNMFNYWATDQILRQKQPHSHSAKSDRWKNLSDDESTTAASDDNEDLEAVEQLVGLMRHQDNRGANRGIYGV